MEQFGRIHEHGDSKPYRLVPIDRTDELYPLRRAYNFTRSFLYWIPVSRFPAPARQKDWLIVFFERLTKLLKETYELRGENFIQYKTVIDQAKAFERTMLEFHPVLGLSHRPGISLPSSPTMEDLAPVLEGKKKFDLREWTPDYCYWFMHKLQARQHAEFLGSGGLTLLFLRPDPKTIPPPIPFPLAFRKKHKIFQIIDVEAEMADTCALMDSFHPRSKELLGKTMVDDPKFKGILFILPILGTAEFFQRPDEECENWFKLFDFYVTESADDKGIVLATRLDMEEHLIYLLKEMKNEGREYPEG